MLYTKQSETADGWIFPSVPRSSVCFLFYVYFFCHRSFNVRCHFAVGLIGRRDRHCCSSFNYSSSSERSTILSIFWCGSGSGRVYYDCCITNTYIVGIHLTHPLSLCLYLYMLIVLYMACFALKSIPISRSLLVGWSNILAIIGFQHRAEGSIAML